MNIVGKYLGLRIESGLLLKKQPAWFGASDAPAMLIVIVALESTLLLLYCIVFKYYF